MNESDDEIKNNFYMFPKDAEGLPVTYFLFFCGTYCWQLMPRILWTLISHLYWSWVRDQDRPLTRWLEIFSGMPEGGVDRERDHKREEDWLETHRSVIWERWPWCCLRPWQWPQEASIQGAAWAERQTEAALNSSQGRKQQKCETLISYMKSKRGEENWVWIGSASERGRGWEQKWWVSSHSDSDLLSSDAI